MPELQLGDRQYDLDRRVLVMGILNRTRDSFYDQGAHFRLDDLLRHAERLLGDGADLLDVGARPGGIGVREVSVAEEVDLVAETVAALRERFDAPISVDSTRAAVVRAGFTAGAVLGNDMSGFLRSGLPSRRGRGGGVGDRDTHPTATRRTGPPSAVHRPRRAGLRRPPRSRPSCR